MFLTGKWEDPSKQTNKTTETVNQQNCPNANEEVDLKLRFYLGSPGLSVPVRLSSFDVTRKNVEAGQKD